MTNNQLAENSITQLLNGVKLARDNAERDDNRVDHSFYYALTIALEELQERRKADSEPVMYCMAGNGLDPEAVSTRREVVEAWVNEWNTEDRSLGEPIYSTVPLYRHAQQPVVPEEINFSAACNLVQINGMAKEDRVTLAMRVWNACRAAMLNGGKP